MPGMKLTKQCSQIGQFLVGDFAKEVQSDMQLVGSNLSQRAICWDRD